MKISKHQTNPILNIYPQVIKSKTSLTPHPNQKIKKIKDS